MSKSIAEETTKMIREFREERIKDNLKRYEDENKVSAPYKVGEISDQSENIECEYVKKLGAKEALDNQWEQFIDTWDYINKRLQDIWHHPAQNEVTWFHKVWKDLCSDAEEYFKAESKYLPKEEQPVVKADKPGIIKAARPEVEVSVLALHRGDGITEVLDQPTTILSKAIEQVEQMGNYKVLMALVDLDKSKPKEERLYTFTDIESEKLREVIYKRIEDESK